MTDHLAQSNMVKQQIRTWGVTEPHLVDLLETIPREHFVPTAYQSLAYAEARIPLAHAQEMMMPSTAARLLQAMHIKGTDKICQIGTGSGFLTALLARLGHHVYAIDLHQSFNQAAKQKCSALGINNINFIDGDAARGWPEFAPYDVVVITGSMPTLPKCITEQVATGGRIFVVLGQAPIMTATCYTQTEPQRWQMEKLFETMLPPLENAPTVEPFIF